MANAYADEIARQMSAAGYSPAAIAAAQGSAQAESNFNPTAVGDNGAAYGGFQWNGPRKDALMSAAQAAGADPADPAFQVKHFLGELSGPESAAGQALKAAQTPQDALNAMMGFERPAGWTKDNPMGGHNYDGRLKNTLAFFGGGGAAGGGDADIPDAGMTPVEGQLDPGMLSNQQQAGGLGALFGGADGSPWSASEALIGAGMAMMARDNPAGAQALSKLLDKGQGDKANRLNATLQARRDAQAAREKALERQEAAKQNRWVQDRQDKLDLQAQKDRDNQLKLGTAPGTLVNTYQANQTLNGTNSMILDRVDQAQNDLKAGILDPSLLGKGDVVITELMNSGDPAKVKQAQALENYNWLTKQAANSILTAAKGAQTEGDAQRAASIITPGWSGYNAKTAFTALGSLKEQLGTISDNTLKANERLSKRYGASFDPEETGVEREKFSGRQKAWGERKQDDDDWNGGRGKYAKGNAPAIREFKTGDDLSQVQSGEEIIWNGRKIRKK